MQIYTITETITEYISVCVDLIIPQRVIKRYQNNKPYVTGEIKDCIKRKKLAYRRGDTRGLKAAQKDLNHHLRIALDIENGLNDIWEINHKCIDYGTITK